MQCKLIVLRVITFKSIQINSERCEVTVDCTYLVKGWSLNKVANKNNHFYSIVSTGEHTVGHPSHSSLNLSRMLQTRCYKI